MVANPGRTLTEQLLLADLRANAFASTDGPPRVGLEVEQLAFRGIQAARITEVLEALSPLVAQGELEDITADGKPTTLQYGESSLTFEPGAQLEIVSAPRSSIDAALHDIQRLETLLDGVLTWRGIRRANHGMNPWQSTAEIDLQTPLPRYRAMQSYFNDIGPDGLRMMRLSCALQINVDPGPIALLEKRWRVANLMSPILIGMFANSPMAEGRVTGWKSTRAKVINGMDHSRTGLVLGSNASQDYLHFALNAGVLLKRTASGYRPGSPDNTFHQWMTDGDEGYFPSLEDWHYHLTTLWPVVRPRGFFELRALDTAPVRWRSVPVAVATALLVDERATDEAFEVLDATAPNAVDLAAASARDGMADRTVGSLGQCLMAIAQTACERLRGEFLSDEITHDLDLFNELYTSRGRCPSDDLLDLHQTELRQARSEAGSFGPYANEIETPDEVAYQPGERR